jgi:hypothetical protein
MLELKREGPTRYARAGARSADSIPPRSLQNLGSLWHPDGIDKTVHCSVTHCTCIVVLTTLFYTRLFLCVFFKFLTLFV